MNSYFEKEHTLQILESTAEETYVLKKGKGKVVPVL
jgi:hypothetical protein